MTVSRSAGSHERPPQHAPPPYFVDCHGLPPEFVRILRSELCCYYGDISADELDYAVCRIAASFDVSRYSTRPRRRAAASARAPRRPQTVCAFCDGQPLNGIIAHLTRKCGGNVHDRGAVTITSSSAQGGNPPKVLADLESTTNFATDTRGGNNEWVCYDFKSSRIVPTHYTIRSQPSGAPGYCNPRFWVVEGSNDGAAWEELDRREDDAHVNGKDVRATFAVAKSAQVRMIRFRQTGLSFAGNGHLMFCAWEIFGTLIEPTQ